jgi:hypothetical protein
MKTIYDVRFYAGKWKHRPTSAAITRSIENTFRAYVWPDRSWPKEISFLPPDANEDEGVCLLVRIDAGDMDVGDLLGELICEHLHNDLVPEYESMIEVDLPVPLCV